jgi:hypothetical protein
VGVGQGEVVDTLGRRSKQADIVIVDEDHPFTFAPDQPGIFLVEGVSAVGEVKAVLTSSELDKAVENAVAFKALEVRESDGCLTHACAEDLERFHKTPPYFLVAMESQLTLQTIHQKLEAAGCYALGKRQIDGVFIVDRGCVLDFGNGQGTLKYQPKGNSEPGWTRFDSDQVLFYLMGLAFHVHAKASSLWIHHDPLHPGNRKNSLTRVDSPTQPGASVLRVG